MNSVSEHGLSCHVSIDWVLRTAEICVHKVRCIEASFEREKREAPPKVNSSICCFQAELLWHVALSGRTLMADRRVSLQWTEPNWPHPLMTHPGFRAAWVWVRSAKGQIKSVGDRGWGQSYYLRERESENERERREMERIICFGRRN